MATCGSYGREAKVRGNTEGKGEETQYKILSNLKQLLLKNQVAGVQGDVGPLVASGTSEASTNTHKFSKQSTYLSKVTIFFQKLKKFRTNIIYISNFYWSLI